MRFAAVLLSVLLTASPVAAAPGAPKVPELFRQFGLIGTWAVDCRGQASPDNPRVVDRVVGDGVVEEHSLGPDGALNHYRVLSAKRLSKTRLAVEVIFRPGGVEDSGAAKPAEERQRLVWSVHDRTRRTLRNQPEGAPLRVKDGIVVDFGLKTPTLRKCE